MGSGSAHRKRTRKAAAFVFSQRSAPAGALVVPDCQEPALDFFSHTCWIGPRPVGRVQILEATVWIQSQLGWGWAAGLVHRANVSLRLGGPIALSTPLSVERTLIWSLGVH